MCEYVSAFFEHTSAFHFHGSCCFEMLSETKIANFYMEVLIKL